MANVDGDGECSGPQLREIASRLARDRRTRPDPSTTSREPTRQHSGTAGRIENCQVGAFLAYRSAKGHALIDRQLVVPQVWTDDRGRWQAAGIPDEVGVATKVEMARTTLARAFAAGVPAGWVTTDEGYGQSTSTRTRQTASTACSAVRRAANRTARARTAFPDGS